jgi:hypothetical protein
VREKRVTEAKERGYAVRLGRRKERGKEIGDV